MAKTVQKKRKSVSSISADSIPYQDVIVTCACGATIPAGSTLESLRVDICSQCHPFFTGGNRILDTEGRVDKFRKKYENIVKKKS